MSSAAGGGLPFPPEVFAALFLLGFPLFWIAIIGAIAHAGWRQVAAAYPASSDPPLSARRLRFASLAIGGGMRSANYGSCIDAWLTASGLWLRPFVLIRPFHPMIFIPWARMTSIEHERGFLFERVRIKLAGDGPQLLFTGALGRAVLEHKRA